MTASGGHIEAGLSDESPAFLLYGLFSVFGPFAAVWQCEDFWVDLLEEQPASNNKTPFHAGI